MGNLHIIAVLAFFDIHTINDNVVFVLCLCSIRRSLEKVSGRSRGFPSARYLFLLENKKILPDIYGV